MDTKITLSFDEKVIGQAKKYAEENNISLSRLTEFVYHKMTSNNYKSIEDFPVSDWVKMVSEGEAVYLTKPRSRKQMKKTFFESKR